MMELARMAWGELLLCVASFYCIFGLEDLALDILWGVMQASRWWQARVKAPRIMEHSAPAKPPPAPSFIAVFIPAWDESAVIAQMLAHTQVAWRTPNHIIYLGVYPNDAATLKAAQSLQHPRLRIVQCAKPGPTTKADCLNTLWQALLHDETQSGTTAKAVLLHDAEDVVHPLELEQINALADEYALVQFPVLPLWEKGQRWVGGHYGDEFAEAHGKTLPVRIWLGAALPAAGVGCAFSHAMLEQIASTQDGLPFSPESLTEDYELGLKIGAMGGKAHMVQVLDEAGEPVAVRAYFPDTLRTATRQKARWVNGISLAGYDRMGWGKGFAENWMRWRDRRVLFAAALLLLGYGMAAGVILHTLAQWLFALPPLLPSANSATRLLLMVNALLLLWRMVMRAHATAAHYGMVEGLRALPRMVVSNVVAVLAAERALKSYLASRRSGVWLWEKTAHSFPIGFSQS